jgi:hypothetical protein
MTDVPKLDTSDIDQALARALGGTYLSWTDPYLEFPAGALSDRDQHVPVEAWNPTTDLEYGQPQGAKGYGKQLIKRYSIATSLNPTDDPRVMYVAGLMREGAWHQSFGPTRLIAAARALLVALWASPQ